MSGGTTISGAGGTRGGTTLYGAGGTGCGSTPSFAGGIDGGTTVSSCYFSKSGGAGINYSGLVYAVVMGGGSSLLGIYDSLYGTAIELILKRISIGVASGISGGGGGSYISSSQIIG